MATALCRHRGLPESGRRPSVVRSRPCRPVARSWRPRREKPATTSSAGASASVGPAPRVLPPRSDLGARRLSGCAPSAVLGDAGYKKELGFSPLSVGLSAVAVALSGVTNRVAHKVASVVFSEFILVLSLVLIVAYIVVYFSALYARMKKGVVTKKMLAYPKWKFGFLGLVDALGLVMQLSAAVHLPGAIIPVLAQINIPFSLLVSRVVLKREFYLNQLAGCFLVIVGVLLSLKPYVSSTLLNGTGHSLGFNAVLYSSSYLFAAIAACVKEGILHNTDYGEEGVDLFVVSSFGSLAQGIVVLSMIFLVSLAQGTLPGMGDLSPAAYLKSGLGCFKENPLPPLVYVCCNILFNVNVVNLVKKSNAVLTTLSIAFVVPLSFIAFSFPIPTLQRVPFYTEALKGLFLLTCGLVMYNTRMPPTQKFWGFWKKNKPVN